MDMKECIGLGRHGVEGELHELAELRQLVRHDDEGLQGKSSVVGIFSPPEMLRQFC